MRVLGIEGTAWAASAAVFDTDSDQLTVESDAYVPESGGIDPREAADHMSTAVPAVIDAALAEATAMAAESTDGDDTPAAPVDAVAFSRGPGLGPCLRIVGTAARTLADLLDVPLVGVNHMIAHLEIGRHQSGFDSPICLNASGANAHVLGYHEGRYRILGETMDTGVGNGLDKFARHVGWSHPGGPKIEDAAADGEYVELPYVVKGMDFSFAGLITSAQQAADDGVPVADLCVSLQEHVFGMLTEVTERALALTGRDELVLGGGVGQNARLREMLEAMCGARGASLYAPEPHLLRDNAGMIAVLGAKMARAGETIAIEDSTVRPSFRPDEVPVTWRDDPSVSIAAPEQRSQRQGAEATVELQGDRVRKRRPPKAYRHAALDDRLRRERTRSEARLTSQARQAGVPTPVVHGIDPQEATLELEFVGECDLQADPSAGSLRQVGEHLARIHDAGFVHGDPTTRNVRVGNSGVYLIDFGLGYHTDHVEDRAMDLHVLQQSLTGTVEDAEALCRAVEEGYEKHGETAVIDRLRAIEERGRYQ
jgi:N6-L-threonylcarbamoyladenine synthase/protein kinase Bud32